MTDTRRQFVMASGNKGKLAEIEQILSGLNVLVLPQSEFDFKPAEETGATFLENALLKAERAARETGLMAIADDSGLCVDALDGRPGVYSARYAGADARDEDNVAKLLDELRDEKGGGRGARFHCVAVVVFPDEAREPLVAEGEWRGSIAERQSGNGGFGYDPVFYDETAGKTAAEMAPDEKNSHSHRGKAFRELERLLRDES